MKNKKLTTVILTTLIFGLMPIAAMAKESENKNKVEVKVNTALSNVNLKHNESDDDKNDDKKDLTKNFASTTIKINGVNVRKSTTTAVVSWKTKLATLGDVRFSTDKTLVASSTKILETGAFGTNHSITLSGLLPDTTYYYIVSAHDSSGQVKESRVGHFKTKKVAAPTLPALLFSESYKISSSSANILWVTSKTTDAKIWFGTTSTVNTTTTPAVLSTNLAYFHNFALANLATSTTYYYAVQSTDSSGGQVSFTGSFVTANQ